MRYRQLAPDEQSELHSFIADGLVLLGSEGNTHGILKLVDDFVVAQQQAVLNTTENLLTGDEEINLAWSIGSVLGNEFVKQLDWVWAMIGDDNDGLFGIVSRDAALALYPSFFVRDCIQDPKRDFTAYLIFNMVAAGRFEHIVEGTCLNLADTVVRIIPR